MTDQTSAYPVRIGILEDDDDYRNYLYNELNVFPEFSVKFSAACIADATREAGHHKIDVCLVDLGLPDGNGIEFTRMLKARQKAKTLILTVLGDRKSVLTALQSGADGYILKETSMDFLKKQIISVHIGHSPISPSAAKHLVEAIAKPSNPEWGADDDAASLTKREKEVLQVLERGTTYLEAANFLNIRENTVRSHVKSIYSKLNVRSRSEAVFEARQSGLLKD